MKNVWLIVQKIQYILQQAGSKTSKRTPVKKFYPLWNCYVMSEGEVYCFDFMIQKWTATVSLCLLKHMVSGYDGKLRPPDTGEFQERNLFSTERKWILSLRLTSPPSHTTHKHKSFPLRSCSLYLVSTCNLHMYIYSYWKAAAPLFLPLCSTQCHTPHCIEKKKKKRRGQQRMCVLPQLRKFNMPDPFLLRNNPVLFRAHPSSSASGQPPSRKYRKQIAGADLPFIQDSYTASPRDTSCSSVETARHGFFPKAFTLMNSQWIPNILGILHILHDLLGPDDSLHI